jgi:acetolactate synthase-1/2/3 large subunit
LSGAQAITLLSEALPADSVVTTGVGEHQMWAMQYLQPRGPRRFLSSAGFGTMGFGLPAAIGAKQALPAATVVDLDGDGSLNMTVNELSTCRRHRLGVKVMVINNQWLGMVRQWQDLIYSGRRTISDLDDPWSVNGGAEPGAEGVLPYPDFVTIARGYRIRAERVTRASELDAAIARCLADPNEPYLLDVMVARESNVFPMIPAGKSYEHVVFSAGNSEEVEDT